MGGLIDGGELWHDPDGEAFVTLPIDGHAENWGVRSRMFKVWLCGRHYEVHGAAPGGQAVEDALRVMEAQAIHRGPEYPTFLRVGKDDGGAVYIDLGGADWRAVKVTGAGWEVVDRVPVKFVRSAHARPLPVPERGESVDRLRGLVNCGDGDFTLIVAWLVASLRPESPYPILIVGGEQGTAKSSLTRALRSLVDPNAAPIRTAPRDERDLLIAARNAWVLAYDNVSGVPEWFSNALCRLSTGGGMGVRQLFTDWEETVFSGERPVILNGIGDLAARPDLADRAVMVTLRPIPDDERRTEREWKKTFEEEAPFILGALFDGVSAALRGLPETVVDRRPRMADFAQWIVAAEPGLGWEDGSFLPVYLANREEAVQASLEADPIALAVLKMVEQGFAGRDRWEGSATELLPVLEDHTSENVKKSRFWPKTASMLSKRLTQAATILRANGVEIERVKGGRDSRRTIIIRPTAGER